MPCNIEIKCIAMKWYFQESLSRAFPLKKTKAVPFKSVGSYNLDLEFRAKWSNQFSVGKVKGKDCLFGLGSWMLLRFFFFWKTKKCRDHYLSCEKLPKNNPKAENISFVIIWLMLNNLLNFKGITSYNESNIWPWNVHKFKRKCNQHYIQIYHTYIPLEPSTGMFQFLQSWYQIDLAI